MNKIGKKRMKGIFCFLLSLVLMLSVFGAMPAVSQAADLTTWAGLNAALSNAKEGSLIQLEQDLTAEGSDTPITLKAGLQATLDLNGFTLNRSLQKAQGTGQVIVIEKGAKLTVKDSSGTNAGKITGGWATYNGSGVYVYGELVLDGGTVTGNHCGDKGAGIFLNGGTATMNGGVIENNVSDNMGGGIYCGENTRININKGVIRNNSAKKGGAAYVNKGAKMMVYNKVSVNCNKASEKGAGFYVANTGWLWVMLPTMFCNNVSSSESNFFAENGAEIANGGVNSSNPTVYTSWSQLKSDIENNKNRNIILTQNITASSSDKEINIPTLTGAVNFTVDLNGFTISRNRNSSMDHGGIFRVEPGAMLTVKDSSTNNSGKITGGYSINGGGICNHGTLYFKGGTVSGNKATKHGGGIYSGSHNNSIATLEITGGVIDGNGAEWGAGVYNNQEKTGAVIKNTLVRNNTASTDGGGIYSAANSKLKMENVTVSGNSAKWGAGVYLDNANGEIRKCNISFNKSSKNGGGLFNTAASDCKVYDSYFNNDYASEKGGAVFNRESSRLQLQGCKFTENESAADGGALYAEGTVDALDGCEFDKNKAKWGAGVYIKAGKAAYISNTKFSNNKVSMNGGALWIGNSGNSRAELTSCTFDNNRAEKYGGGVYMQGKGTLLLYGCLLQNHFAKNMGGAIYSAENDTATLGLVDTELKWNDTDGEGGGIYANNAVISLKGLVKIHWNDAADYKGRNLVLNGKSYVVNPALYKNSQIDVFAKNKTIAKEISEYQTRYFNIEQAADSGSVKYYDEKDMTFKAEKTVDTPIIGSIFNNGSAVVFVGVIALGAIAAAVAIIQKKKKGDKAENEDE